ncbi:hypothetical protein E2P81_ATG01717 [Venturia nashicola]|uniref:Extracellular serine-rich protein n=1 Tax=Venturia nashicola TaxID=86259 RepID=A0A4Z1NEN6_9PEZI|nr:hypothetical protein E6O75_ATG01759 [Venturia nashicola]TLD18989.1 hypothetical protein E2P81_ATG01717 [Venturia nashicola]
MRCYDFLSYLLAGCATAQQAAAALAGSAPPSGIKVAAVTMNQKAAPSPTAASDKIRTVIVGGYQPAATPGGMPSAMFSFTPESITAQPGDTIRFTFMGNNHSVVQTTLDSPCAPVANGFNSGYLPNTANQIQGAPTMDFQVKDANPMYMSCLQVTHCGKGMVLTINAPTTPMEMSHSAFKAAAIKVGNPELKNAGIQAAAAVPQVASTVSIKPQGVGAAAATGAAPGQPAASVVPGTGKTGSGQSCGCQCLCGAGSFPANAGVGAFGGVGGVMPDMGAMSPAPAAGTNATVPAAAPPVGQQGAMAAAPPAGMILPSVPNVRRRW